MNNNNNNNNNNQLLAKGQGPLGLRPRMLRISSTETGLVMSVTNLSSTIGDENAMRLLLQIYETPTPTCKDVLLRYVDGLADRTTEDIKVIHGMRFGGNFQRAGVRLGQVEAEQTADAVEAMLRLKNKRLVFVALAEILTLRQQIRDTLSTAALTKDGKRFLEGFLANRTRNNTTTTTTTTTT